MSEEFADRVRKYMRAGRNRRQATLLVLEEIENEKADTKPKQKKSKKAATK